MLKTFIVYFYADNPPKLLAVPKTQILGNMHPKVGDLCEARYLWNSKPFPVAVVRIEKSMFVATRLLSLPVKTITLQTRPRKTSMTP